MTPRIAYLADNPELVPQVVRWWHSAWADRMAADLSSEEQRLLGSLSRERLPIHLLAYVDGEPAGSAALKQQELGDLYPEYQNWLGSVFVDERFRGRGLASALSREIIGLARRRGMPHLYLQTVNLDGGLYARLGWQALERFEYRGEQSLLMWRRL